MGPDQYGSLYPDSRFFAWVPSRDWWKYRSLPAAFIVAVWSVLFYALLSFIPIFFPVFLPLYALPLIAVSLSVFTYLFGKPLRSLFEPLYRPIYKFLLKTLFAKSEAEADEITSHLTEQRSLAQQLVDYVRYFFNLRLREDEEQNERLKIRIAKFNIRWGAAAKLVLNSFFLATGSILLIPLIFGVSLTPGVMIGLIAFGVFGGICSSLIAGNLFGNGLVALAKAPLKPRVEVEAQSAALALKPKPSWASRFDYWFGLAISATHALAGGAACFSAGMQLVMMLGTLSVVAANPFIVPVLLALVAVCSLAIARGYYALTRKVWDNKAHSLKGFFSGNDGDGKPVGSLQRIFGFLGAVLVGLTISAAFVMLNGTAFAEIIKFPIYNLVGSGIQFNFNPVAIISFITTGIIGGVGVGVIFLTGTFKLFRDFGKSLDDRLSSAHQERITYSDKVLEKRVTKKLRENYGFSEAQSDGPGANSSWLYRKHWNIERSIRAPIIILMSALATGMLTTVPNVVILLVLAPPVAIPVAIALFSITAIASMCKDYMNWLPGYENRSHIYAKAKEYLYQAELLTERMAKFPELSDLVRMVKEIKVLGERRASLLAERERTIGDIQKATTAKLPSMNDQVAVSTASLDQLNTALDLLETDLATKKEPLQQRLATYAKEYDEIKPLVSVFNNNENYPEIIKTLESLDHFYKTQPLDLQKRAEALRDGYDPHLYGLVLTGIVRIVSNIVASLLMIFSPLVPELATAEQDMLKEKADGPRERTPSSNVLLRMPSAPLLRALPASAPPAESKAASDDEDESATLLTQPGAGALVSAASALSR